VLLGSAGAARREQLDLSGLHVRLDGRKCGDLLLSNLARVRVMPPQTPSTRRRLRKTLARARVLVAKPE